jgi:hypothetical protein
MASRRLETDIDRLYQLPLEEFTAARNALARTAGENAADVRRLVKPSIPAWAVNQLYWKRRDLYDALIDASAALRKTHKTILGGRRADLREPSRAHEDALDAALKGALALLQDAGHPATDATRQGVLTTLRALPTNEPPGRLTETQQPGGFEMLQGLSIAGSKGVLRAKVEPARIESHRGGGARADRQKEKVDRELDTKRIEAARAVREAEQAARREEFESMRAARDAEKMARQLERAREALKTAQQVLAEAETAAAAAERDRDAAARRAKETERLLEAARRHHDAVNKR